MLAVTRMPYAAAFEVEIHRSRITPFRVLATLATLAEILVGRMAGWRRHCLKFIARAHTP
jgi:hypothetical protein